MHGNKVFFSSVDGSFGNVGSMDFWRGILEAGVVPNDECSHIMGGLIVKFV